ncbi:uncharacterized protein [Brachionichthys hirsutus]|uniref:uncharacterized protein n=1 Tax=Brachionichthys hirsutus TaxID=412623 RepID=UPI0036043E78
MCEQECLDMTPLEMAVGCSFGIFRSMRGDNKKVSLEDFRSMLREQLPGESQASADEIFSFTDLDEDGYVDYKEFMVLFTACAVSNHEHYLELKAQRQQQSSEAQCALPMGGRTIMEFATVALISVFEAHACGDDKLSKEEFRVLMKEQLPGFTQEDVEELFSCADENKDGSMEFKEFCTMFFTFACLSYGLIEGLADKYSQQKQQQS